MAAHYRQTIADVLKDFDNGQHSSQFYLEMAWEGLNHSTITAWKDAISQPERDRIDKVVADYITQNKNQSIYLFIHKPMHCSEKRSSIS